MSDITYVGKQLQSFESSPQFDGFSKVVITVSDEVEYSAGTDTGRTLSLSCPWGTQAMAENILSKIKGHQYQPYTATDAIIDPAAELGDGITVNNVYSGIYTQKIKFGPMLTATVSAPEDEEINHEYPYISKQERTVTRNLRNLTSELKVQAGLISAEVEELKSDTEILSAALSVQANEISAKVSKTGGSASSFGWVVDDSSWTIQADSADILKATKNGLEVKGKITATSGKIGGFNIEPDYLSYNNQTWGGTNSTGIYWGPSGIQCGSANKGVQITPTGYLYAENGYFRGSVNAGSIQYGGDNGTLSGSALSAGSVYGGSGGAIAGSSLSTYNLAGGINTSLGYANFSNDVFNGYDEADQMQIRGTFKMRGYTVNLKQQKITDADGNATTIRFLAWG